MVVWKEVNPTWGPNLYPNLKLQTPPQGKDTKWIFFGLLFCFVLFLLLYVDNSGCNRWIRIPCFILFCCRGRGGNNFFNSMYIISSIWKVFRTNISESDWSIAWPPKRGVFQAGPNCWRVPSSRLLEPSNDLLASYVIKIRKTQTTPSLSPLSFRAQGCDQIRRPNRLQWYRKREICVHHSSRQSRGSPHVNGGAVLEHTQNGFF